MIKLESEHLVLLPHEPAHLLALLESADAYVTACGRPIAPELRGFLLSGSAEYIEQLRHATLPDPWQLGFAVVHKDENRVIGLCGFPGPPDAEGTAEIAYGIAPEYEERGFAQEAATALIKFASADARVKTIRAHTLPQTNASTRILEKCGFVRAGTAVDEGNTVWRWEKRIEKSEETAAVNLDPTAAEIRAWGQAALDAVASYTDSLRDLRVYPETSSHEIRQHLDAAIPHEGRTFDDLLATFRDVIVRFSRHNGHPRMFGYVQSPGTAIAAFADLLASFLNANLTAWRSAPAAVELERLTIDWIKEIVGFERDAAGLFVSGGSLANLSALAAARQQRLQRPLSGARPATAERLRFYVSRETHHSIAKGAALLGFAPECLREVATRPNGTIDPGQLVASIRQDERDGAAPFAIVATAGTVMTGAVDPLNDLANIAAEYDLWMHVDACYGGFAALAPSLKPLLRGIERADSVALDPHKWLYLPVDCGCVLYRDAASARNAFAHDAAYTRVIDQQADEAFAYWDYGPELSRRFRALKVWMLLKGVGLRRLGEAIEENAACARHLEKLVHASDDFEMLAPVELSIFCFRYLPQSLKPPPRHESAIDNFNERLLVALQRDGSSYLSNAVVNGRFALRGCVINYRTTKRDIEILLDDLRRVGATLTGGIGME